MIGKFSVVLLAKNSAGTLPRLIKSIEHVECERVLVDTGSTDATIEIAKAAGFRVVEAGDQFMETLPAWLTQRVNKEFVVDNEKAIVQPGMKFFRFDKARNFAADQATGNFLITPDTDEYFTHLDVEKINALIDAGATRFKYDFVHSHKPDGTPEILFRTDTRCFDRREWRWKDFVHETLQGNKPIIDVPNEVMYLEHTQEPGKEHRLTYLAGLAVACYREPSNDRNMHYFGRELVNQGRPASSIKVFERHLALSKWDMEMSSSLCYMGDAYEHLGNDPRACVCWHSAFDICGSWREPFMRLAWMYFRRHDPQRVAALCAGALQIPNPHFYGSLQAIYEGLPHELFYWALYYLGRKDEARAQLELAAKWNPKLLEDIPKFFEPSKPEGESNEKDRPADPVGSAIGTHDELRAPLPSGPPAVVPAP